MWRQDQASVRYAQSSGVLAAEARELADGWEAVADTHGSANAVAEAQRRARLYEQLAQVFDVVVEAEELARFEDRNTLALRQDGGV